MQINPPQKSKSKPTLWVILAAFATAAYFWFSPISCQAPANLLPFSVLSAAGEVQIYSHLKQAWAKPVPGQNLTPGDQIKTGPEGEVDLLSPGKTALRVKSNSVVSFVNPIGSVSNILPRIQVHKGEVISSSITPEIQMSVPHIASKLSKGIYLAGADPANRHFWLGVLEGKAVVQSRFLRREISAEDLQKVEIKGGLFAPKKTSQVSQAEWSRMNEAYELQPRSALSEAEQLELSKQAGSFFKYVFDHGTFYNKRWGFASREIFKEEESGDVIIETRYDVFPRGSWVGLYLKTRDLDGMNFKKFSFQARRTPDKKFPETIRIEFKTKFQVLRSLAVNNLKTEWQTYEFPLRFSKPSPITEATVIYLNEKVGVYKKGSVQFKNVSIE